MHVVKAACERPDDGNRSLCQWDCMELARHLAAEGLVDGISRETVRRILSHHQRKPWRYHLWLSPTVPRDARFAAQVREVVDLSTRPLAPGEEVVCADEKTRLQSRPHVSPDASRPPGAARARGA